MRVATFVLLSAGLALFVWLIADHGAANVFAATAAAGWGVAAVTAFHLLPMLGDTLAWRIMMVPARRLSTAEALRIRWIAESVNNLLPAAPVGGDLVRTRLAMFAGMSGPTAGASVIGDLTFGALAQVVFSIIGVAALIYLGGPIDNAVVAAVAIGLVVVGVALSLFLVVQNRGLFRFLAGFMSRLAQGRLWLDLVGGAATLDAELASLYTRRSVIVHSMAWRLSAWITGAGEIWLGLYFLDYPVGLIEAIMIESLIQAVRAAAFAVPGGLGVQEAGFVLLGSFIGIGPEISLALALVRRARELLFGIPGLIAWQVQEGNRIVRRQRT